MTKDEALQLALEVLEKISMGGDPRWAEEILKEKTHERLI